MKKKIVWGFLVISISWGFLGIAKYLGERLKPPPLIITKELLEKEGCTNVESIGAVFKADCPAFVAFKYADFLEAGSLRKIK